MDFEREEQENVSTERETNKELSVKALQDKYKAEDGKVYTVSTVIAEDDDTEKEFIFIFRKPSIATYDRYAKTAATSNVRALKTFVLDNIVKEQYEELSTTLEEYPAMALGVGEKLLNMLGLSKDTTVKKL